MGWQALDGGDLELGRWPRVADDRHQAWDAADEYFLRLLRAEPPVPGARLLLVDDHWGALGTALARCGLPVAAWGDSCLDALALAANLRANGLEPGQVPFTPADASPPGPVDLAWVRLPKELACLEDTLGRLRPALAPGAVVIAGGMIKHTPTRAWRLLEQCIGPTATTPGWKKARLGVARAGTELLRAPAAPGSYRLAAMGLELVGAPGVFGGGRLDGGTALLLRHLPADQAPLAAVDLGCGDGVLALALACLCPAASVLGIDASHRAVACARANLVRNAGVVVGDPARVRFAVGDGLSTVPPATCDLIVCNPPFHQGHAVADVTAERLFAQAQAALRPGGRLLVVGNRHLGHQSKLDRVFGGHELLDGDPHFTVLGARRSA